MSESIDLYFPGWFHLMCVCVVCVCVARVVYTDLSGVVYTDLSGVVCTDLAGVVYTDLSGARGWFDHRATPRRQ